MEPRRLGTLLDFLSQGKAGIQAGYGQGTGRAGGSRPFPVQAGGLPHIPHMRWPCQRVRRAAGRAVSRESGCSTQVGWDRWDLSKCCQQPVLIHAARRGN